MKITVYFILTVVTCWKPTPAATNQDTAGKAMLQEEIKQDTLPKKIADSIAVSTIELKRKSDSLRVVKNELFQEELKLQEELASKKQKVIIKEVPIPVLVEVDTSKKKEDTIMFIPVKLKKRTWIYKLFHHKKRKK